MNPDLEDVQRTLRRHVQAVVAVAIVLVLALGGWAATTEFSGAVIAHRTTGRKLECEKSSAPDRRRGGRAPGAGGRPRARG